MVVKALPEPIVVEKHVERTPSVPVGGVTPDPGDKPQEASVPPGEGLGTAGEQPTLPVTPEAPVEDPLGHDDPRPATRYLWADMEEATVPGGVSGVTQDVSCLSLDTGAEEALLSGGTGDHREESSSESLLEEDGATEHMEDSSGT
jgi:hypothetical protein